MISSLSTRLLVSVGVLLLVFFSTTIVVLDIAFRDASEQAQRDILDSQLMSLLAAANPDETGNLAMPPDLPEPRFSTPGSGLYAEIRDADKEPVWRSRSALGLRLPRLAAGPPGEARVARLALEDGAPVMTLTMRVNWEFPDNTLRPYTFHLTESLDSFNAQIAAYRRQLFGWFSALALLMLFAIALVMRSLLRPLRQIENEIGDIEAGERKTLSEEYPAELHGVARNMNLLIGSERGRSERYRQTLDNLAHSLKTPLAAMRSVLDEKSEIDTDKRFSEQINRMDDIVRYQLRKPAQLVTGGLGLPQVEMRQELQRLCDGFVKVYRDKTLQFDFNIAEDAKFRGDRGDFMEVAGNLLDNACKWCKLKVVIGIETAKQHGREGIRLVVEDDGGGIPAEQAERLLERGTRLDESAPGHGIGLSVVRDIAAGYGGTVDVSDSRLGGACFAVTLFSVTASGKT
ncbi:MAG: GHKL domain-containing protein [Woeseia sp.]|nr:GHKL domain-containing protein [Woeseia sp.]